MRVDASKATVPREDEGMNETIPVRVRPANPAVLALLTVLTLVIAPICAPLCAARSCSSGGNQERCHEMASVGANESEHFVAPIKGCGAPDFSAVLLKADEEYSLSQAGRSDRTEVVIGGSPELGLGSLRASPAFSGLLRVPLASSESTLPITILRL
jgi:hypothetical protein